MIYLTIHRKDGFGVYYLTIIKAIIFSKEHNITYLHTPSTYIAHHNNEPDFPLIMEKFCNVADGEKLFDSDQIFDEIITIDRIDINTVKRYFSNNSSNQIHNNDEFLHMEKPEFNILFRVSNFDPKVLPSIDSNISMFISRYYRTEKPEILYYTEDELNVAVHIRRGKDISKEHNKYIDDEYYLNIIKHICSHLSETNMKYKIHIFSQQGLDINKYLNDETSFNIDENIRETFHAMVCADILVISPSSTFSIAASLLNTNCVINRKLDQYSAINNPGIPAIKYIKTKLSNYTNNNNSSMVSINNQNDNYNEQELILFSYNDFDTPSDIISSVNQQKKKLKDLILQRKRYISNQKLSSSNKLANSLKQSKVKSTPDNSTTKKHIIKEVKPIIEEEKNILENIFLPDQEHDLPDEMEDSDRINEPLTKFPMMGSIKYKPNLVQVVSFPRSGNHLLAKLLEELSCESSQFEFKYCEFYKCCKQFPCTKGCKVSKTHDWGLKVKDDSHDVKYIIQYRKDMSQQMSAFYRFCCPDCKSYSDIDPYSESFQKFMKDKKNYYYGFMRKWLNKRGENYLHVEYYDFIKHPMEYMKKIMKFIYGENIILDLDKMQKVINDNKIEVKHVYPVTDDDILEIFNN